MRQRFFQYPNRWILFSSSSYQAGGNQFKPVTPVEATEWFLRNGLEVPKDLYEFLPTAPELQTTDKPETSEQIGSYQEPPNGQKYGPVMDEWGNPTTLTYYSPCYWILHGHHGGQNWRKALTPGGSCRVASRQWPCHASKSDPVSGSFGALLPAGKQRDD